MKLSKVFVVLLLSMAAGLTIVALIYPELVGWNEGQAFIANRFGPGGGGAFVNGGTDGTDAAVDAMQQHWSGPVEVSVVIPVFDVEKYIAKCIETLLSQTLHNIEFIFVDDLGHDRSMQIVQDYARFDSRIRVLRNAEHIGTGPSRNAGARAARGRYVGFLDPDDWVSNNFYMALLQRANDGNYDIAKGTMVYVRSKEFSYRNNEGPIADIAAGYPIYEAFYQQHQSAIFRKQIIDAHDDIGYGSTFSAQDLTFLLSFGFYAKNISFTDEPQYFYYIRKDSVSNNFSTSFLRGALDSMNARLDFLESKVPSNTYDKYLIFFRENLDSKQKRLRLMEKEVDAEEFATLDKYFTETLKRIDKDLSIPYTEVLKAKLASKRKKTRKAP